MASPYRPAEAMLPGTSPMGMSRTSAPPGPNMYDGSPTSLVGVNHQDVNNNRLLMQNEMQNRNEGGVQQAQSAAIQGVRKEQLIQDNADYKANDLLESSKALMLEAMGNERTPGLRAMGEMNDVEAKAHRGNVAAMVAQSRGINPDLVV